MASLFEQTYNPDVLSCIANLSNDEVFTPPEVANLMLDLLPKEIWSDSSVKILDPACKTGVFLREAAKRFIEGLSDEFPVLEERLEHIFKRQLFGIAITELTSLLSRRSVYCSKYPTSKYSVARFSNPEGNIDYKSLEHAWMGDRCLYCGASKQTYKRDDSLESYAYEFIHMNDPKEMFDMKFDVIISNPPYQLETGGMGRQAKPVYQLFVEQAKKLNPRFMTMIIPSRWFAGGMGLDNFRSAMMNDKHVTKIVDYTNAKECFPQNSISGGVCYFLRERDVESECTFVNIRNAVATSDVRPLNEFPVIVRYNEAVNTLHKVISQNEPSLTAKVSSISPFGLSTSVRGTDMPTSKNDVRVLSSQGFGYISEKEIERGQDFREGYKVALSQTGAEHACEPDRSGMFRVLTSSMRVLEPSDVCTHSYLVIGPCGNEGEAKNLLSYLKTKFVRYLILQAVSSIHISKQTLCFVPDLDFSIKWTDEMLYEKYKLNEVEIEFIEGLIKPMEADGNA